MNKVTTGSGFVVTGVMGGIASFATSLLPKTLFPMNSIAQSACRMFIWTVNKFCFRMSHISCTVPYTPKIVLFISVPAEP